LRRRVLERIAGVEPDMSQVRRDPGRHVGEAFAGRAVTRGAEADSGLLWEGA
jgi:hypothetical protein